MTGAPDLDSAGVLDEIVVEKLLHDLDAARDRLRRGIELLEHALILREQLWWGLDLDHMQAEVAVFKYACAVHRWWRRSQ